MLLLIRQQEEFMNKIVGIFEKVDFPEIGVSTVRAKIDTGAYSGALHCVEVYLEETPKGKVLCFVPVSSDNKLQKFSKYRTQHVKSSNGHITKRFVIDTTVIIQGQSYPIRITLAHRDNMKNLVLIGRRFLRLNKLMVDASQIKK